jgi:hypothetical protein
MKRFRREAAVLAALITGVPAVLGAQVPRVALFGGYTYVRAKHNSGTGFNLNGWDASLEGKSASWLGWLVDLSQQYGSPSGVRENQTSALFGPQVSVTAFPRFTPFAHALVGLVHGTNNVSERFGGTEPCPPACGPAVSTGTTLGTAVGGGLDFQLAGPVWIRAAQVDYLHARLSPDHHNQVRIAAGLVLRLGR